MERHPHFDLRLHSDAELGELIGSPIIERVTLHQWPLSCVQCITDAEGQRQIYKAQAGPTVEDRLYAAARSPLLPQAETLYAEDGYVCLLLEYVDGSQLEPGRLSETAALSLGADLLDQIGEIEGDLPAYRVFDGAHWGAFQSEVTLKLKALAANGTFAQVDDKVISTIERALADREVAEHVEGEVGLVHGDLTPDNLMIVPDGYRLIDWQYARRGPPLLDLATFLEALGFDPLPHVDAGIVRLMTLMRIHWLVECATTWFPPGAATYESEIVGLTERLAKAIRG